MTLKKIESGASDPRASTLAAIEKAFLDVGVVFLDNQDARSGGSGVRFKEPR